MTKKTASEYENNPFMIGLEGLKTLFERAQNVAIFAIVLSALGLISSNAQRAANMSDGSYGNTPEQNQAKYEQMMQEVTNFFNSLSASEMTLIATGIATVLFIVILINLIIAGVLDYTAGRLYRDKTVSLKAALKETFTHIASYLWLQLIIGVKILLWSLLFIIPGFIMAVRYSLSGAAFFNEGLRGTAAVDRSKELTKNAWLTTFAGQGLWNIMTFGVIRSLLHPAANAVLYRQLADATDTGTQKPEPHWLSWLTLVVPIVAFTLLFFFIALMAAVATAQ